MSHLVYFGCRKKHSTPSICTSIKKKKNPKLLRNNKEAFLDSSVDTVLEF